MRFLTRPCLHDDKNARGNALFLILIAVALFAALSYAVTLSGRGNGGTARETGTINAALITDYPASVRATVTRMILSGTTANTLDYTNGDTGAVAVFDGTSGGGGATWATAPPAAAQDTTPADATHAGPNWRFRAVTSTANKGFYVAGIGTPTGQEAIAFVDVTQAACLAINGGFGLGQTVYAEGPFAAAFETTAAEMATESLPTHSLGTSTELTGTASSKYTIGKYYVNNGLGAQAFACVSNTTGAVTGPFLYYHTLIEQ